MLDGEGGKREMIVSTASSLKSECLQTALSRNSSTNSKKRYSYTTMKKDGLHFHTFVVCRKTPCAPIGPSKLLSTNHNALFCFVVCRQLCSLVKKLRLQTIGDMHFKGVPIIRSEMPSPFISPFAISFPYVLPKLGP